MSCVKAAEPVEVPLGFWTQVGLKNHVLDGVHIPHAKWQFWGGKGRPLVKVQRLSAMGCAKIAESIEIPFGMWTPFGLRKHVIRWGCMCLLAPPGEYDWTVHVRWQCDPFVKLLWPLVLFFTILPLVSH